jgi:hypothetical protein
VDGVLHALCREPKLELSPTGIRGEAVHEPGGEYPDWKKGQQDEVDHGPESCARRFDRPLYPRTNFASQCLPLRSLPSTRERLPPTRRFLLCPEKFFYSCKKSSGLCVALPNSDEPAHHLKVNRVRNRCAVKTLTLGWARVTLEKPKKTSLGLRGGRVSLELHRTH